MWIFLGKGSIPYSRFLKVKPTAQQHETCVWASPLHEENAIISTTSIAIKKKPPPSAAFPCQPTCTFRTGLLTALADEARRLLSDWRMDGLRVRAAGDMLARSSMMSWLNSERASPSMKAASSSAFSFCGLLLFSVVGGGRRWLWKHIGINVRI